MNKKFTLPKQAENKGFFLVDILIAVFLLSVALVPILGLFIQAMKLDSMAKNYTIAANLAQKQLELLKTHTPHYWNDLALPCTIPWQDSSQLSPASYAVTTTGISIPGKPLVQVTVIVTWQEYGKDCNVQFVTFYPQS